jgi:hypothetical protein
MACLLGLVQRAPQLELPDERRKGVGGVFIGLSNGESAQGPPVAEAKAAGQR